MIREILAQALELDDGCGHIPGDDAEQGPQHNICDVGRVPGRDVWFGSHVIYLPSN